ncbi:hypothetical protein [Sodalis sp. dw_96]|uniref:hypothetical protein n=1 Tax=Sodalis sp. dw_96 TaxID=2719794 RepID=UPI001BD2813A|nr:hypothetical protein [Sodalis sp. dw_96]
MCKKIVFCLFFLFPLTASASNVVAKEALQHIITTVSFECLGEPVWPISVPMENDSWLLGRLGVLAGAGLVRPAWSNNRPVWLLTPTGTPSSSGSGDGCINRMLLRQGSQEACIDR